MFNHLNIDIPQKAIQISQDGTGSRMYLTPDGKKYPSITTILVPYKKDIIDKWTKRVGEEEAHKIKTKAAKRGDLIHSAVEGYLKTGKLDKSYPFHIQSLLNNIRPYLGKIGDIHVQEAALYSDMFQTAGRCDLICEYDGKLSVVDFKGSNKDKKEAWIDDYCIQVSFYAYAYYERTGYKVQQCVVLVSPDSGNPQEFIIKPSDWWGKLKEVRINYKKEKGI